MSDNSNKHDLINALKIDDEQQSANKPSRKKLWLLAALLLVAVVIGYFSWQQYNRSSQQTVVVEQATTITKPTASATENTAAAIPIATVNSDIILSVSGYVVARRIATVSSEITAKINAVYIEEGMRVTQGQVLAQLDDIPYQLALDNAKATLKLNQTQLQTVQAQIAEAKRIANREQTMFDDGYSNEARLTQANTNLEVLQLTLEQTKDQIEIAKIAINRALDNLDATVVKAPFAGVIINKAAQEGEIISPISAGGGFTRTGIGTLVDMNSLEIEVDVNEAFIARLAVDQPANAYLDAYPDWKIDAKLLAIVPTANRSKATVRVRVAILTQNALAKERILPDMAIKVNFLPLNSQP